MKELSDSTRKVFLNYAFKDFDKFKLISMKLREHGFEVVSDCNYIKPGDNVNDFYLDKIDECDCFILIIADNVSESSIKEFEIAINRRINTFVYIKKDMFTGDIKSKFSNRVVGLWENEDDLAHYIIDEISRYGYRYPQRAYQFELIVNEIYKLYGCSTVLAKSYDKYDILAEKHGVRFYIEAKATRQKVIGMDSVVGAVVSARVFGDAPNSKYVLVVANKFSHQVQRFIRENENIIALEISNLLYIVQNNELLKSQLLSILEYSVDEIEPEEPKKLIEFLGTMNDDVDEKIIIENLIKEVQSWQPNERTSGEYEDLCIRVLKNLFVTDLGLWSVQQRSNEDLYRFDLICKIKDNIKEAFWKFIEEYFRSKYVIFEFKNYSGQITQKEIYTTDKYLYAKALRSVAIILSCNGEDKNAQKAMKGTLRENGKLILSISNKDLIMMLNGKIQGDFPAEYLYGMLDTILVELDK